MGAGTGGTITTDDTYYIHTFSSSGNFVAGHTGTIQVQCWGPGGNGQDYEGGQWGGGAGGGAYAATYDIPVVSGVSYPVVVGTVGVSSKFNTTTVVADYGRPGTINSGSGGAGGSVANSTGTTRYAGGNGGVGNDANDNSGGGGGCAGPNGNGVNGHNSTTGNGGDGGNGNNSLGGGGGAGGPAPSGNGSKGGANVLGGGGGGGAGGPNGAVGGSGGIPGGGGGSGENGAGSGARGQVVIKYIDNSNIKMSGIAVGKAPAAGTHKLRYFDGSNVQGIPLLATSDVRASKIRFSDGSTKSLPLC